MATAPTRGRRDAIPPPLARFVETLPWIVLGGADRDGAVWATALFGDPGFICAGPLVSAVSPPELAVDSVPSPGDPLDEVLGGSEAFDVGLLAIDLQRRMRARINGLAQPGSTGLRVLTHQVYANCMKYIQRRAVVDHVAVDPQARAQCREHLDDQDVAIVERADTIFVATQSPSAGADVSHRGGRPGFVEVQAGRSAAGHTRLQLPDYPGNNMFDTFANLEANPRAGILVPDFATGDLLHLTGRAQVVPGDEPARRLVFDVERVVRRPGASPLRFGPVELSPFVPPLLPKHR